MSQVKWFKEFFDAATCFVRCVNTYILCCTPEQLRAVSISVAWIEMIGGVVGIGVQVFTLLVIEKVFTWKEVFGSLSEAGAFFMRILSSTTAVEYLAHIGLGLTLLVGIFTDQMVLIGIWLGGATAALIAGIAMLATHIYAVIEHESTTEENVLPMTYLTICIVVFGIYFVGTVDMYRKRRLQSINEYDGKSVWS